MTPIVPPHDAVEVAATIGFALRARALWSGERCTWFDAIPTMPTQNPATSTMSDRTSMAALRHRRFLAQAATRTGDARCAAPRARAAPGDRPRRRPRGSGTARLLWRRRGVGAALVLAGGELDDAESSKRAARCCACRWIRHRRRQRSHRRACRLCAGAGACRRRARRRYRPHLTRARTRRAPDRPRRARRRRQPVLAHHGGQDRQPHRLCARHRRHRARVPCARRAGAGSDVARRRHGGVRLRDSNIFEPAQKNWPDFRVMPGQAPARRSP